MVTSWISKAVARPSRAQNRKSAGSRRRRSHLGVEALENRLVPSSSQTLGNLKFITDGSFTTDGSGQVSTTSAVRVEKILSDGVSTSPDEMRFDGGVQFQSGDPSGSFTALGEIWGFAKGKAIDL